MAGYINTLIITMIVSQLSIILTPERESAKRYIKLICSVSILLCIISPLKNMIYHAEDFFIQVKSLFLLDKDVENVSSEYFDSASVIFNYITDTFDVNKEDISISIITDDETNNPIQIHIYISRCERETLNLIEDSLNMELKIPTFVFGKEQ